MSKAKTAATNLPKDVDEDHRLLDVLAFDSDAEIRNTLLGEPSLATLPINVCRKAMVYAGRFNHADIVKKAINDGLVPIMLLQALHAAILENNKAAAIPIIPVLPDSILVKYGGISLQRAAAIHDDHTLLNLLLARGPTAGATRQALVSIACFGPHPEAMTSIRRLLEYAEGRGFDIAQPDAARTAALHGNTEFAVELLRGLPTKAVWSAMCASSIHDHEQTFIEIMATHPDPAPAPDLKLPPKYEAILAAERDHRTLSGMRQPRPAEPRSGRF